MIQVFRLHTEILPILSDIFQLFVPAQRLPHIKSILARFSTGGIVVIIINHPPKDTVSVDRNLKRSFMGFKRRRDEVKALHTQDLDTSQRRCCSLPGRKGLRTMHSRLRIRVLKLWSGSGQGLIFYVAEQR